MKIRTVCLLLLLPFTLLSGCASFYSHEIDDDPRFVKIGGDYYRLAEPAQTAMLQVGDKGDGAFNSQFRLKIGTTPIEVRSVTRSELETGSQSAYDLAASAGIPVAHVSAGSVQKYSNKRLAQLNVVNVIDLYDLADIFNDDVNQTNLARLADYDNPRIVSAIVFIESLSDERAASGNLKIGANYTITGKVDANASGSVGGDAMRKETLSKGTVFAYQLSRICWTMVNNKPKVTAIVLDRQGQSYGCPANTKDSVKRLTASTSKP